MESSPAPRTTTFVDNLLAYPDDKTDPRVDIVHAKVDGLPRTTIVNAQIDPLRGDGSLLTDALKKAAPQRGHSRVLRDGRGGRVRRLRAEVRGVATPQGLRQLIQVSVGRLDW